MKNGHLDIKNGLLNFFFLWGRGILHILKLFLPYFRRKTIIYLFIASYICSNGLLYLDASHFKFAQQIFIFIIFCDIF